MWKPPEGTEKVWVAGATGYTGNALVRLLTELKIPVVAHIRPASPNRVQVQERFEQWGAQVAICNWELKGLLGEFRSSGATHVFSLLGTTAAKGRTARKQGERADYETVDYGLTLKMLKVARESGRCERFSYLSAVGVHSGVRSPYMRARAKAEQEIRDSGLAFTIAQPALITGPDREESRPMEAVGDWMAKGVLGLAKWVGRTSWTENYRTLNARTLAAGMLHAAFDPNFEGKCVSAGELARLAEAIGSPRS